MSKVCDTVSQKNLLDVKFKRFFYLRGMFMDHKRGESREQVTLCPIMLDELVGEDALVRVVDAWIESLDMQGLGFQKSQAN